MAATKWSEKVNLLYDAALALVYPQRCAVCGAESVERRDDAPACARCWQSTRVFTGGETLCRKCGAPAAREVPDAERREVLCRRCDDDAFTAARSAGVYEGALRAAVLRLKREPGVTGRLARMLVEAQRRAPLCEATLIVPVPLGEERERERGFNQALVLAGALASLSNLPLDQWSLRRSARGEAHRAGMDRRGRRESVAGAFRVVRPRLVEGERILLIDDVFTTGATASSCAEVLRAAGAEKVFVLTLARAC